MSGRTLETIHEEQAKLKIEQSLYFQNAMKSGDVEAIFKAQQFAQKMIPNPEGGKAIVIDPFNRNVNFGFYDKPSLVNFSTLRSMSQTTIPNAILTTRRAQIVEFTEPQTSKYSAGFIIRKKRKSYSNDSDNKLTKQEQKEIDILTEFVLNCGDEENRWMSEDFGVFAQKFIEDSLALDQGCFEVVRGRVPRLEGISEFYAVDGATIRLADSFENERVAPKELINGYAPSYVQILNGQIQSEWYPWELCLGIRNPQTNIFMNGYGKSELEILINTVTDILNASSYNSNYFRIGSNPKGILKVKGMNTARIEEFRQNWLADMVGVQNCLTGDNFITTKEFGRISIAELFETSNEPKFTVWTGENWEKSEAAKTGKKKISKLILNNSLGITTSPDHKIKVIGDEGLPVWKRHEEILEGDFVLVNKKDSSFDFSVKYKGQEIEDDLFEVLGWLIGDGWIGADVPKKRRLSLFYHPVKEAELIKEHLKVLKKYGIVSYISEEIRTEKQIEKIKNDYGFKSVSPINRKIHVGDYDFHQFLIGLGFKTSSEGKNIPSFLYVLDGKRKGAFLRGLFSADGNNYMLKNPSIAISNDQMRASVKQLLLTMGIRTSQHEGLNRITFNVEKEGYRLLVKDRKEYFNKIGFIQAHKQPKCVEKAYSLNSLDLRTAKYFVNAVFNSPLKRNLSKKKLYSVYDVRAKNKNISHEKLIDILNEAKYEIPSWLLNYHFEKVVEVIHSTEEVEMYDLEVFDDVHQFIANGIVTHNSHKLPIIDADSLDFINTQASNKDMEYHKYLEFLIKLSCAIYKISPEEIGFTLEGSGQSGGLGSGDNKTELEYSRNKGLIPLLKYLQKCMNKFLISPKSKGKYELVFLGLNQETEKDELESDVKKVTNGGMSMQDFFKKYSQREFDEEEDIILNPIYLQYKQMQMMGNPESNEYMDQEDQNEEVDDDNPFLEKAQSFLDQELSQEKITI